MGTSRSLLPSLCFLSGILATAVLPGKATMRRCWIVTNKAQETTVTARTMMAVAGLFDPTRDTSAGYIGKVPAYSQSTPVSIV
jgi:hypothetical protein